jgi:hypothetical protein
MHVDFIERPTETVPMAREPRLSHFFKEQPKTAKNSGRFAVISALDCAEVQDFCSERGGARCKFPGRTAKNSEKCDAPCDAAGRLYGRI